MFLSRPGRSSLACAQTLLPLVGLAFSVQAASAQTIGPTTGQTTNQTSPVQTTTIQDVVVTAERPASVRSIDRQSYAVGHDLQSAAGSASDVLRNLPSVDIDAQGTISLRGDSSVQVLVDGQPSTRFSGANRADSLEQMSAATIDRIEVITNPSAQFRPDGTGGVINIITKRSSTPGQSGTMRAAAGSDGRYSLGATIGAKRGPFDFNANAGLRHDERVRSLDDERRRTAPDTDAVTTSSQSVTTEGWRRTAVVGASLDYDITEHDQLSLGGDYTDRIGRQRILQHNVTRDGSGGVLTDTDRNGRGREAETSQEITGRYQHTFGDDHSFTVDLRHDQTIENRSQRLTTHDRRGGAADTVDIQSPRERERQRQTTLTYVRPTFGGNLVAGYDLLKEDADYQTQEATDAAPPVTRRFLYDRTIHAVYATYDHKLGGRWEALAGLRVEDTTVHGRQLDLDQTSRSHDLRVYPTLHLQYDLSDEQTLRFSYSKRIARPEPEDLNPYPVFSDPLNIRAGNPDLRPRITRAYEASWQVPAFGASWETTAYYRDTTDAFTNVRRFISPTVVLTTPENLGRNTSAGLEVAGQGRWSERLTYRISGNLGYNRYEAGDLAFAVRSGLSGSAKAGVDYKITAADLLQLTADYRGRRQTAQGYRSPVAMVNLGYRHSFKSGAAAVLTMTDLFDSSDERDYVRDSELEATSVRRNGRRVFSMALTIPFGGKTVSEETPADAGN